MRQLSREISVDLWRFRWLALGLFLLAGEVRAQPSYNFQTLDNPAAVYGTSAAGMVNGSIVGTFTDSSGYPQGFLYDVTTQNYTALSEPDAVYGTFATGISGGNIIGYFYDSSDFVQGLLYNITNETYTTLADPDAPHTVNNGTYPKGIDGSNIVGYYYDSALAYNGFLYDGTTYTTLDDSGGGNNWATGISGGNIVGYYLNYPYPQGYLYNGTTYTTLNGPAGSQGTYPQGVSGGNIVGYYADASGNYHGFVYNGTAYTTLDDPLAAQGTYAIGISGNYIVGYYKDGNGATHGFLATLVVAGMPVITTQPVGATVTPGQNITLTSAASGTPTPLDEWQISSDGGFTWSNLTDANGISGSATGTLKITNADTSQSGDEFRLFATNSIGWVASNAATITVSPLPSAVAITAQPANQTVTIGQTATITMAASGSPTPTFQWQREAVGTSTFANLTNGGNYQDVTTATMFVTNTTLAMTGDEFQCVVSNSSGSLTSKAVSLTVNKALASVILGNLSQKYDGSAKTATVTTNPEGLVVNVTYNGTTIPPSNVGSYAVVATIEDANYAGSGSGTLTITKAAQVITFPALAIQVVGNAPFVLTATAASGLPVSYTSSNAAVATVSGNTVTIIGKGTATITASQAGNANYTAAPNVSQTLTVNQIPGFTTSPANKTVVAGVAATFTVAATGLPTPTYQWQLSTNAGATWSNLSNGGGYAGVTTTTLSVSGTALAMSGELFQCVASNSAGTTASNPATLTVTKAPATVTLSSLTQTYTGVPRVVTVATSPAGLAFNLTYNGSTTAPTTPGSYAVVATVTDANHAGSASGTLVIKPVAATVTLGNLSQKYDGNPKTVTVTTNPASLAFNVTYNGSTTPPVSAGSYAVVATITDPNSTGKGTGTLTVAKVAQTITFGSLAVAKVGDAAFALTATASSGLVVSYTSSNAAVATVSGNSVTIIGKGTTTITAAQTGDVDYTAAPSVGKTLTVNQIPVFTTPPANKTVAAGVTATFTVVAAGLPVPAYQWQLSTNAGATWSNLSNGGGYAGVTTTTLSVSGTTLAMSGELFQCVASNSAGNTASNPATLTVTKAAATVTLSNLTQTYTGAPRAVTVATSPAGLAFNLTYNGSTTAPTIPGSYAVMATITDANHMGSASGTLAIKPATATVTLGNLSQKYDGNPKTVTVTTNPTGLAFSVTYNGSTTEPVNAGSYPVVVTITDPNSTGKGTGTLTVAKATQTITFPTLPTQIVGNAPFSLTATAGSGLAVNYTSSNAAVATVSGNTITLKGKGTATITASQAGNTNFTPAPNVSQTLTVNQIPVFTTSPANKTVAAGVTATFTVAATGLPTPTYQWQLSTNAGATWSNLSNGGGYSGVTTTTLSVGGTTVAMSGELFQCVASNSAGIAASNPATLTVTKAPATVTLSNLTQTYTGSARTVTVATGPAGLAFNLTYNGSITAPVNVGSYAVVATITDANRSGSASGTLVIKAATATMTLGNFTQKYDGTPKMVTVMTSPASLAFNITYNGSTTEPVNAGSYPVVATITDANYTGKGTGTLTIAKAAQTITFGALPTQLVGGGSFALTATASSGLSVSYTSSNAAVAKVSGNTVTIMGKGTATITASQTGNANYTAAPNVTQVQTVIVAVLTPALASPKSTTTTDSPALAATTTSSASYSSSNTTDGTTADIISTVENNEDTAAWVSGLDPDSSDAGITPTATDLPTLLLEAMNLDIFSPDELLPIAAIEQMDGAPCLILQYRQSREPASPLVLAQYSTDGINWYDVPASNLTQLPDDDDNTERWAANVAVPSTGPIYLRLMVTQNQ